MALECHRASTARFVRCSMAGLKNHHITETMMRAAATLLPGRLLFLIFLLASFPALLEAAHYKVFLLGGQSNALGRAPSSGLPVSPVNLQMPQVDILFYFGSTLTTIRPGSGSETSEFGPEVSFGRAIADALPADNIAIIKYAAGGTALYNDWAPGSGPNYTTFRNTVTAGLAAIQAAGHTTEIVGMLWHQGESDAIEGQQAAYQTNLTAFITDIRSHYGPNLPFLIGEIRRSNGPAFVTVADAQIAVAAAAPNLAFVPASDLSFWDTYHFDAPSQVTLGQRFATAYLGLVNGGAPLSLTGISRTPMDMSLTVGTTVSYTLAFSKDMDAATVTAADFSNAGTATVSWGNPTETAPGVVTLAATPTTPGTLQLQIVQGAQLLAADGEPLDTASPITDTSVITVQPAASPWISGVSIDAESSLFSVNRSADNIINGNGFTEASGFHSNAGGDGISWTSGTSTAAPLPHYLVFDLGANHDLSLVKIWNWNTGHTLSAGSKDIDISVASSVGSGFTPLGSFVLTIGPGQNNVDFGQIIDLSGFAAANDARLVRIDIKSNHGWTNASFPGLAGLSEIRFAGSLVPNNTFATWIADPAFGINPADQGVGDDPDGDGIANGVENFFGTHPGEFSQGLLAGTRSGNSFTFTHPQNATPAGDLTPAYRWSTDLIDWYAGDNVDGPGGGLTVGIAADPAGPPTTTVTATASQAVPRLFIRVETTAN